MRNILYFVFLIFPVVTVAEEFQQYCISSLANGSFFKTDCSIKSEFGGKEYCFGNKNSQSIFVEDPTDMINRAISFYSKNTNIERQKTTQLDANDMLEDPDCDLSNKDLGYLNFKGKDLTHCIMINTSFFGADLRGANLAGANLQRAYLNLSRLEETNFTGANLTEATIFQPIFGDTIFKSANLTNARVIGTLGKVDMSSAIVIQGQFGLDVGNQPMGQMKFDSSGGNFARANFQGADLNIASFIFGNLREANLSNTNLYRAELIQADLTGADLTGANLTDADVDGADFKNVKGLDTVKGFNTVKGKCKNCGM
jgi:uncharacterized protein YjbI with pentapeptide repeats|tara:strand:- start:1500 stop:2438 length:939 start_codon:yes stop_codon:yes gene_type:complete